MRRSRFRRLVAQALAEIPEELWARIENVAVLVHTRPEPYQLEEAGIRRGETLLGLYEGRPVQTRGTYGETLPDRIYIFQEPIESICRNDAEVVEEVRDTVLHEVAHYFGIDHDDDGEIKISTPRRKRGVRTAALRQSPQMPF